MLSIFRELSRLDRSPIPRRWLPKLPERAPDVLSRKEQEALCSLPEDYGRVLRLLLGTGIRWGELVRAEAKDVRGGKLIIRRSKSGKVRRIPLAPAITAECQNWVGRLSPFPDACAFNRGVRKLSGIERFHSHLCRHTFATEWREAGGSLAALQAVLGHGTIAVTERYGTISEDLVEREAQRLVRVRTEGGVQQGAWKKAGGLVADPRLGWCAA